MNGVLRNFVGFAGRALARSQLDLRRKRLFGAGREHYGAVSIDAQFKPAQKARVIVKEARVRRTRRHDVAGDGGGEESLAVNQGQVVDLARLRVLVDKARLRIGRNYLHQLRLGDDQLCAHATICSTSFTPFCSSSVYRLM